MKITCSGKARITVQLDDMSCYVGITRLNMLSRQGECIELENYHKLGRSGILEEKNEYSYRPVVIPVNRIVAINISGGAI